jgi:hypothetical protein
MFLVRLKTINICQRIEFCLCPFKQHLARILRPLLQLFYEYVVRITEVYKEQVKRK